MQVVTLCISTTMVLILLGLVVFCVLTAQNLSNYVKENLTAEKVDAMIIFEKDDGDEIRFFKRSACIRALINRQFMNLDQQMLDTLVDEKLYDMLYEE